jgi:phage gp45-like
MFRNPGLGLTVEPESVFGKVRHANTDKPLGDVIVTVYGPDRKQQTSVSDDTGRYGLQNLKPGTYKIIFEKDGFRKVVKEKVTVREKGALELNIEMDDGGIFILPMPLHFFEIK